MDKKSDLLAPPAIANLRAQGMERSLSEDIREERDELREAAEQSLNVIVDLSDEGIIRWVSPSWVDVVGTQPDSVQGVAMSSLIVSDNKEVFVDVLESMKKDDSRSQLIRFTLNLGPSSQMLPLESLNDLGNEDTPQPTIDVEAQGIMVYDKGESGKSGESHSMWMIRPWVAPREIKIDLPGIIVESLGSGAEVLASYLTQLAESGLEDPASQPPPPPVLCRICERQISPWWFEKHTDLCMQEHRAEMDVQMAQENLTDHRHAIVKVLDALEARKSRSIQISGDQSPIPVAEYKGMPIGPPPSTASSPGTLTPPTSSARSRERSGGFGHSRGRSFAIRRPQARIVELLLDLTDTALEISTPAIKESSTQSGGDFRTQSPQSESRISQVMQWQSPSTNTLDQEQGLALLCADTERVSKAKVEAVFRHRRIIEYAERIRIEFTVLVQDCIDDAMRKAARIAAGRLSDSASEDADEEDLPFDEDVTATQDEPMFPASFDPPPNLPMALTRADTGGSDVDYKRMSTLSAISAISAMSIKSTRSSSPKECPTPRSGAAGAASQNRESRRESMIFDTDPVDSDGSIRSSSVTSRQQPRTESPISEFGDLRRAASTRQHNRKSWILPGTSSPRRQESPSRGAQPASPLRISKPRNLPSTQEGVVSPQASPMLPSSEFGSPAAPSHHHHLHQHHRRQSSTAASEFVRPPPSPRLNAVSAPQARAVPPSIKDFEIIKPISKGAFGSVYLSKKKSTGEYFAIKVLKKADMVAKNQVTNVKAERAIMMWQGESDFVAKLYWTFSSKDYLYLVMEYLNGGDCAALIKVLGGLPEDWVQKYLGEVILGVEHLHSRGIIHRDLKPDNLLIDQKGHLKLTDFGLSRMGLVGRQKRALKNGNADTTPDLLKHGPFARSASITSSRSTSLDLHGPGHSPGGTPQMTPESSKSLTQPSYFNLGSVCQEPRRVSNHRSDSGGSETLTRMLGQISLNDTQTLGPNQAKQHPPLAHSLPSSSAKLPPEDALDVDGGASPDLLSLQHSAKDGNTDNLSKNTPPQNTMMPPPMALFDPDDTNRRFVGTPDYLAPETIKGERQDETSDWWSVGCIMFEFLYGIPPFHAPEAELVFENILARRIGWPPDEEEFGVSPEAKDLMNKLLCMDPQQRLGSNKDDKYASGGEEIRNHPWFAGMNWDTLLQDEAQFVPQIENPEDTEYFDPRGAAMQQFTDDLEDHTSPPSAASSDYVERPHDALSRVRSQVNNQVSSLKRGLMPLHIPPHVRDLKSRRLSEPVAMDDFGSFTFKNLPVLEKANKDVIQKLRAEAMASQSKNSAISPGGMNNPVSPCPPLDGSSLVSSNPVHRNVSNAKASSQRPQSPSGINHANSSPSRISQPSSPLLVSFVANGQGSDGRRKVSNSSSGSLAPGSFADVPRVPPSLQKAATTVAASPVKARVVPSPLPLSPQKGLTTPRQPSSASRSRSLTVGSQEGSPITSDLLSHHRNRRSQVFDMSPSSSDNEGDKANALLRVQRRRQSSRRLSQIAMDDGPIFRPLDVLICEDHPVSRMVMEKLLEKLRCRTISATTGPEAVRYSMSEIKFDIIFMEFKLPHINGSDVARMIRETKNANSHTPIVAITAYLKELQAPHYFDSLIEKPISSSKLTEVLGNLCQWKQPPTTATGIIPLAHPIPSSLRQESMRYEDSPTSGSSIYAHRPGSSFRGSSREDSISSSVGDIESVSTGDIPSVISRKATGEWDDGLGIRQEETLISSGEPPRTPATLVTQQSAPAQMESMRMPQQLRSGDKLKAKREHLEKRRHESTESADDEDDELGASRLRPKPVLPSSKLGIEMMRANSYDSVIASSDSTAEPVKHSPRSLQDGKSQDSSNCTITPPDSLPVADGYQSGADTDETSRPRQVDGLDPDPTPRPAEKPFFNMI